MKQELYEKFWKKQITQQGLYVVGCKKCLRSGTMEGVLAERKDQLRFCPRHGDEIVDIGDKLSAYVDYPSSTNY